MTSYALAIWSDGNGDPDVAAHIPHVVRVGRNPDMALVNEFTDGGQFEHADCADAVIQSRLIDGGVKTTVRAIEEIAGTSARGTLFPGVQRALTHFEVANSFSGSDPPPGYIMNPAGGRLVDISQFPKYLAASQGGCITMADPPPDPSPPKPPIQEPEMQTFVIEPGDTDPTLIPAVTGSTSLVLAAFAPCTVQMFLWNQLGGVVAERVATLEGNEPGKQGPAELSGYLYGLFAPNEAAQGPAGPPKAGVPYLLGLWRGISTVTKQPVEYSASVF